MSYFVEGAHNERAAPGCVAWCPLWQSLGSWHSSLLYRPSAWMKCLGGSAVLESGPYVLLFCCRYLTGAIEQVSASSGLNQIFLGLIVLPIAGNACEHITAVSLCA